MLIDKICRFSKNLLSEHFNGMVARAKFRISNGKIEGINNKIKTLLDDRDMVIRTMNISSFFKIRFSRKEYVQERAITQKM